MSAGAASALPRRRAKRGDRRRMIVFGSAAVAVLLIVLLVRRSSASSAAANPNAPVWDANQGTYVDPQTGLPIGGGSSSSSDGAAGSTSTWPVDPTVPSSDVAPFTDTSSTFASPEPFTVIVQLPPDTSTAPAPSTPGEGGDNSASSPSSPAAPKLPPGTRMPVGSSQLGRSTPGAGAGLGGGYTPADQLDGVHTFATAHVATPSPISTPAPAPAQAKPAPPSPAAAYVLLNPPQPAPAPAVHAAPPPVEHTPPLPTVHKSGTRMIAV